MSISAVQHSPLKWVGGKLGLLNNVILPKITSEISRLGTVDEYHEPCIGSGVVALNLLSMGVGIRKFYLSDINFDLIAFWISLQQCPDALKENLNALIQWTDSHPDKSEAYYSVRTEFNKEKLTDATRLNPGHAAKFLYLNRMGFRGVYRENKSGEFNVPYGNYKWPVNFDIELLDVVHELIKDTNRITFQHGGINTTLATISSNKSLMIYVDPPYYPVKDNAFVGYVSGGFKLEDHTQLFKQLNAIKQTFPKVSIMLSNANVPAVVDAFPGWNVQTFDARRACNSADPSSVQSEVLITT